MKRETKNEKRVSGFSFFILNSSFFISFLLLCSIAAGSLDPKPPQVGVAFLYPPSPLVQDGSTHLVYEMRVTNYSPDPYQMDSLDVTARAQQAKIGPAGDPGRLTRTFVGDELKNMTRLLGAKPPADAGRQLEAGRTAIIYFTLDLGRAAAVPKTIPKTIQHTIHFTASDGNRHALAVPPLEVSPKPPVVVAPPLRGPNWIAGDSSHNGPDAAHRRTILLVGGEPWLAQRYAIDWVQYRLSNGVATTWSGPEDRNASYFCYNQPVLSVAAGTVVAMLDGLPENVPHSGKYAVDINFINAGGNYAVVDIGGNRYAFYAHMRPGSVKVKMGDRVTAGQVLGYVGNTGSSTEPHLHMHIVDHPSFLAGQGVPYAFTEFKASGATEFTEKPDSAMEFRNIGPLTPRHNDYPANNAAVQF